MLLVEDAQARILARTTPTPIEEVPLLEALGRPVARDLASDIDISPFANSAMDGFAVHAADLEGASRERPVDLEVVAHIGAGSVYDGPVEPGQAVRIMTGAPMPAACDSVVKIEDIAVTAGDGSVGSRVAFYAPTKPGSNVRPAGQEAQAGQTVMHAGDVVDSAGVGLLASCGHATVPVHTRPRVGIIATGSELVDITEKPGPGKIRNSNSSALAAQALEAGAIPTIYPAAPDDHDLILATVRKAVAENVFVASSGGASNGDYDFITQAVAELGELIFDRVNMRPGKCQTFGVVEGTPVLGLAGNPAAAFLGFEVLIRPALRKMQGFTQLARPVTWATLAQPISSHEKRREYLRGRVERTEDGGYTAVSFKNQSSALIGTMHQANCLLVIPEGPQDLAAGDKIRCLRIDQAEGVQ